MKKESSMNMDAKMAYLPPTVKVTRVVMERTILHSPVFEYEGPEWIEGGEVGGGSEEGDITLW